MSEAELVRVEVTTTLFVDPSRAESPEWRSHVRRSQQALGVLAGRSTEVTVDLSFDGLAPADYDDRLAEQLAENQHAAELASAGELLDTNMTTLLLQAGGRNETGLRQLGGRLRNNGLNDVCAVLAVGREALRSRHAGSYGRPAVDAIEQALATIGVTLSDAPSAKDVALFCENLGQVPGQVLIRAADEADEKGRRNRTKPEDSQNYDYFLWDDRTPHTSEGWSDSDLLKRSIADLHAMSLDDLVAALAVKTRSYPKGDPRNLELAHKRAQALHTTLQHYIAQFTAAKEKS